MAEPSIMIAMITAKSATEVPSLNKLSHSKISASRFGAPTDLKILRTATGSVALMSAAKSKHTRNGISRPNTQSMKYIPILIISVDISSHTTARVTMEYLFFKSSR